MHLRHSRLSTAFIVVPVLVSHVAGHRGTRALALPPHSTPTPSTFLTLWLTPFSLISSFLVGFIVVLFVQVCLFLVELLVLELSPHHSLTRLGWPCEIKLKNRQPNCANHHTFEGTCYKIATIELMHQTAHASPGLYICPVSEFLEHITRKLVKSKLQFLFRWSINVWLKINRLL